MQLTLTAKIDLSVGSFDSMYVEINDIRHPVTWDSEALEGTFTYKSAEHEVAFADMSVTITITEEEDEISSLIKKIGVQVEGYTTGGDTPTPSSGLPEVTSADNGMVLTVVEGEWNKADPSTEIFYVDVTEDSTKRICNKTYGEIRNAFFGGKIVIFRHVIADDTVYSILRRVLERNENGYWFRTIDTDVNSDGFNCESSVSEEDVNSKYPEYYF